MPIEDGLNHHNVEIYTETFSPREKIHQIREHVGQLEVKYQNIGQKPTLSPNISSGRVISPRWVVEETARLAQLDSSEDREGYKVDVGYLDKVKEALSDSDVRKNAESQISLVAGEKWDLYYKNDRIQTRINEIARMPVHKRMLHLSERRRLEEEHKGYEQRLKELDYDVEFEQEKANKLKKEYKGNSQKLGSQETLEAADLAKDANLIHKDYQELVEGMLKNTPVLKEVRNAYIEATCVPRLDELISLGQINPEEKADFLVNFQLLLDHNKFGDPQKEELESKVKEIAEKDRNFRWAEVTDPLIAKREQFLVERFVFNNAVKDFDQLKVLQGTLPRAYLAIAVETIDRVIRKDFYSHIVPDEDKIIFSKAIYDLKAEDVLGVTYAGIRDLPVFLAIKDSPTLRGLFGEQLNILTLQVEQGLLDKSLDDFQGTYIDALERFPTPEVVSELVILATADHANYRTVHANVVLNTLAKNPNWSHLLDQTIAMHPLLDPARSVLEKWDFTLQPNNAALVSVARDFAEEVFKGTGEGERLHQVAFEACGNDVILGELQRKNLVDQETKDILLNMQHLVERLSKMEDEIFIDDSIFRFQLREDLLSAVAGDEQYKVIPRVKKIAKAIVDHPEDRRLIKILSSPNVYKAVKKLSDGEGVDILVNACDIYPNIGQFSGLLSEYPDKFLTTEGVYFLKNLDESYGEPFKNQCQGVAKCVAQEIISFDRALALSVEIPDLMVDPFFLTALANYPKACFGSTEATNFFRNALQRFSDDQIKYRPILNAGLRAVEQDRLSSRLVLDFAENALLLSSQDFSKIGEYVLNQSDVLIKDLSDIRFLNGLVGSFNKKAQGIIEGYTACLKEGAITTGDKNLVSEFLSEFKVVSPNIMKQFKEAKQAGSEKVFLAELKEIAQKLTGAGKVSESEMKKPYYRDLVRAIYGQNSGGWTSYQSNESCQDRSSDLDGFEIRPNYPIDLLAAGEIKVKDGMQFDKQNVEYLKNKILGVAQRLDSMGHDSVVLDEDLTKRLDESLATVVAKGGFNGLDLGHLNNDEKLFLLMTDSVYGVRALESSQLKELLIQYEFTTFEDIRDYIQGTTDRVGRSNNPDYALLCELDNFFADRVKEVHRRIVQAGWDNHLIAGMMPDYFKQLSQSALEEGRWQTISRLQVDKLGMTDGFIRQIGRLLKERSGRDYSPEQVRMILERYESMTGGLIGTREINRQRIVSQKAELGEGKKRTKEEISQALYGQFKSQRERTANAASIISGQEVDLASIHLGEINLQQMLETESAILSGNYDGEQFASYTAQRFMEIFQTERLQIEGELNKFISSSGRQREVLNAYISKSKPTANARMVGGVCVSGDNPGKNPQKNMWDMENYFQLVLQDPDTLQCQGLGLLHHFEEDGQKVLTASLNPSSTYLYSVDEAALFNGMVSSLTTFAEDNGFDKIMLSQNAGIRTNRTGGRFESTMSQRVAEVGEKFSFASPVQFSFSPNYQMKEMDIIWNGAA